MPPGPDQPSGVLISHLAHLLLSGPATPHPLIIIPPSLSLKVAFVVLFFLSPLLIIFSCDPVNARLKGLGFGKRRSTASLKSLDVPQSQTPPPTGAPTQIPQQSNQSPLRTGPAPSIAPSIAPSSSQQSLPMNHPGPGARPPSYTANYPPQGPPPPVVGRTSPLTNLGPTRTPPTQVVGGPPPINTGAPVAGYPPPQVPMQGGPPPGGPPGYAGATGYPPPPPPGTTLPVAPYSRTAAEVEGNSRSKAQLIVGIDFVSHVMHCIRQPATSIQF